mmetsp:Transcript_22459/g.36022  ORF Transcript_22459/g.36022 Transcript_22459/m.36022 type:complete len:149 (+) Transcript_22459:62-508(+)
MSMSQPQWMSFANSEAEYKQKERQKLILGMKLKPHQDLLSFYLLSKACDRTLNSDDEQFNLMPEKYVADLKNNGYSLPPNFYHHSKKGTTSQMLENDKSLLATLLGGYHPPPVHMLNINPLDEDSINTLKITSELQPVQKPQQTVIPK